MSSARLALIAVLASPSGCFVASVVSASTMHLLDRDGLIELVGDELVADLGLAHGVGLPVWIG